jgi:hypothetical protein
LSQQCTPPLCCCFIVGCCQYTADAVTLTDVALLLLPLHARYCNIFSRYIMTVLMMISQLLQWPFEIPGAASSNTWVTVARANKICSILGCCHCFVYRI